MSTEILAPPELGTMIWLHSLKTLALNGQRALVCQSDAAGGGPGDRCTVQLLDGGKVISARLSNLSLSPLAYFCVREAPERGGLGVFATQDIPAGVQILSEAPLLNMPLSNLPTKQVLGGVSVEAYVTSSLPLWSQHVSALSSAQQAAFYRLHDCKAAGGSPTIPGIVLTNSYNLGLGCCVFLVTSRINHSCIPNCNHGWNSRLGRKIVHTDRAVKCGEELTLAYFQELMVWKDRNATLEGQYRFTCGCEVCTLTGSSREASDKNRTMAVAAKDGMNSAFDRGDYKQTVRLGEGFLALLERENLATASMMYRAEFRAFQACKMDRLHVEARRWLELSYKHSVMAGGADTEFAQDAAMYLAEPVNKPR